METIPIVDLDILTEPNPLTVELLQVAYKIRDALHSVGFMYLKNHLVPDEIVKEAFKASSKFFRLSHDEKSKYKKVPMETNHGWVQAGQELLNSNSVFELREAFDFVTGDIFPIPECPDFCPTMDSFKTECRQFMKTLLPLMALALGLDDTDFFTKCCEHMDNPEVPNECDLRAIHYPPVHQSLEIPPGTIRCAEHTDYELCTLLFQDDVGGLEVKRKDGAWIPATPVPGAILVNSGDLLERWTSGYFPATKHRVIIPSKEIEKRIPRYSFAYFFAPDNSTIVSPLTSHVLKDCEKVDIPPITAYDHIMNKVKEAYQY